MVLKRSNESGRFIRLKILTHVTFWIKSDSWSLAEGSARSSADHASFMDFRCALSQICFSRIHGSEKCNASSANDFKRFSFTRNPPSKQRENLHFFTRRFHLVSRYLNTCCASNAIVHRSKTWLAEMNWALEESLQLFSGHCSSMVRTA